MGNQGAKEYLGMGPSLERARGFCDGKGAFRGFRFRVRARPGLSPAVLGKCRGRGIRVARLPE